MVGLTRRQEYPVSRSPGPDQARSTAPAPSWRGRALFALRRHWLVSALLTAGLALRVAAQIAYSPALLYTDTLKYLYGAWPGADPLGYTGVLKVALFFGSLATVTAVQHLVGLAMAGVLYAVLLRRGTARWLAALAVAPVLLDAYQLQIEQTIMPDVWFEAMIVAGLAVLLWRPRVTLPAAIAAGLVLGSSAAVREVGAILIVPAAVFLLAAGGGWRQAAGKAAALCAAFVLPILCYCAGSYALTGHFWLSSAGSATGRLAGAADCAALRLPAAVRPVCPTPAEQARGADWLDHSHLSPLQNAPVPHGISRAALGSQFDAAVERQQPLRVLGAIARDSVRLFAPTRAASPAITPISRWQFQDTYPVYPPEIRVSRANVIVVGIQASRTAPFRYRRLSPAYGGKAQVDRPVAAFLRSYQLGGGYTPGPLLAIFALAGLLGSLAALCRRPRGPAGRELALGGLLFFTAGAAILLVSDVYEFSWRYQLPALVTLPAAGVLAISLLIDQAASRRQAPARRRDAGVPARSGSAR
jgi:hypothetical protein